MLEIQGLKVRYGQIEAVREVSFSVKPGQITALIGANGAGKSSTLRAISGLVPKNSGEIHMNGENLSLLSASQIAERGLAHCPEGRRIFGEMTVRENLLVGGFAARKKWKQEKLIERLRQMTQVFPVLQDKLHHMGSTLSGGEQQMLAMARALMMQPQFLLLDEPTLGLAPQMIAEVMSLVKKIRNEEKVGILLVEQMAFQALEIADEVCVLDQGKVALQGKAEQLKDNPALRKVYLG